MVCMAYASPCDYIMMCLRKALCFSQSRSCMHQLPRKPAGMQDRIYEVGPHIQTLKLYTIFFSMQMQMWRRRCLQTTMFAMEGVKLPPEKWTITCAVCEVSKLLLAC